METLEPSATDLLVAAFNCMQPSKVLLFFAREVGSGILSTFAQQFFLEKCLHSEVQKRFPASQAYVRSVVKQMILAAEKDGEEVLEDLYNLHLVLMEGNNGLLLTERCYKTFTFFIPEISRSKLRHTLGVEAASEVIKRTLMTIRVSTNMLDGDTGYCVWPAGLFLAEILLSHPQLVHGKSCLELGSGTGICGIWLSLLAPSKVLLTDGALSSLVNLRHNLAINGISGPKENNGAATQMNGKTTIEAECRQLVWEFVSEEEVLACKPEVIIGADLIYDPTILPGLVRVLSMMLKNNSLCRTDCKGRKNLDVTCMDQSKENEIPTPVAYLASAVRNVSTLKLFINLAANCGLEVSDVTESLMPRRILPDVHLIDRAQLRLYKVGASQS